MRRDMDLVREILLKMEEWKPDAQQRRIEIEGRTPDEITYHLGLMAEHGLIKAIDASDLEGAEWIPQGLTWEGHEFLDAARSDTVWKKAKERVMRATGTVTLEAMKIALNVIMRQAVEG